MTIIDVVVGLNGLGGCIMPFFPTLLNGIKMGRIPYVSSMFYLACSLCLVFLLVNSSFFNETGKINYKEYYAFG